MTGGTNTLDDLPPNEALISLLSEAFQASLPREESRPITCRLVLVNPSEVSEAERPPTGMHVLPLEDERKLSAQEIRRLSPCTTFYRSLIGPEARMNLPGSAEGNWYWRCTDEMLSEMVFERLNGLTATTDRAPMNKEKQSRAAKTIHIGIATDHSDEHRSFSW